MGSAILDWVTGGSALATLGKVSIAVCALVLGLVYRRYLGILGADRRRPAERQAHDALRASLAEGNMAARLYARRLTGFLDWIDRFFGDAGMADRTLFPQAFGLRTPAPLWTAPAFDAACSLPWSIRSSRSLPSGRSHVMSAWQCRRCIWHRIYPAGRDWARVGQLFGVSL